MMIVNTRRQDDDEEDVDEGEEDEGNELFVYANHTHRRIEAHNRPKESSNQGESSKVHSQEHKRTKRNEYTNPRQNLFRFPYARRSLTNLSES